MAGGSASLPAVAAENIWGSLIAQLSGDRVQVASIVNNPAVDPHDFEPKPADARLVASARYVAYTGAGYDPWMPKLLEANPVAGRRALDIGRLVGKKDGDNPHLWYHPDYVAQVADRVTADLIALDPADRSYFDAQHAQVATVALQAYRDQVASLKQTYAGTPVGATETVFDYMAEALGLTVLSPLAFRQAITDGREPAAADKAAFDQQIAQKKIKVLIYNRQNATPDTDALRSKAAAAGIPVVEVTETLDPPTATFQDWQLAQLRSLQRALAGTAGR